MNLEQTVSPVPKRPYSSPVVEVFGSIRQITKNVGKNGGDDGSGNSGATSKTKA